VPSASIQSLFDTQMTRAGVDHFHGVFFSWVGWAQILIAQY